MEHWSIRARQNKETAQRIFRDELETIPDPAFLTRYHTVATHPDKIVRAYEPSHDSLQEARYMNILLNDMELNWGIPTVHPQYIVTGEEPTSHQLMLREQLGWSVEQMTVSISDRIHDAVSIDDALERAASAEEVFEEFEALNMRQLERLVSVYENGGFIDTEQMHYGQYVYSPSAPAGKRLILVDIQPFTPNFLPPSNEAIDEKREGSMLINIYPIVTNILKFENAAKRESRYHDALVSVIQSVHSSDDDITLVRDAFLDYLAKGRAAVASGDEISLEHFDDDEDEDIYEARLAIDLLPSISLIDKWHKEGNPKALAADPNGILRTHSGI